MRLNKTPTNRESGPPRNLEEHLAFVKALHTVGEDLLPVAEGLVHERYKLLGALEGVREVQEKLRDEIDSLCAPEHYPAVITRVHLNGTNQVEVHTGAMRIEVGVHPAVAVDHLRVGARGLLSRTRNCLLSIEEDPIEWQDVGAFEGYLDDRRRMLLRHQEQLLAVTPAHELAEKELKKGDLVGFDRDGGRLAYARVDPPGKEDLFFENTPADRFEELGGLDAEIARLKWAVEFRLKHAAVADRYKLQAKKGILLEGPPGNGKTKLARCLARYVADLVPAGQCRFMAIAGSADYSMWLGQSEQRLIARFEAARDLAAKGDVPVVMFFDEIDAIGRRRGTDYGSGAPDRILATFLAQLDGVQVLSNLIVIGATNRADTLDPGLIRAGRLGDFKVRVPSPNRTGSRAILARYLAAMPTVGVVEELVQALLSRVYSERGEHAELAHVKLRDGNKVVVRGRDLVSGAMLENVVRTAAEEAADREVHTGPGGITEDDLARALERELRGSASLLTPGNVRCYVTRLPQDVDPVSVEVLNRGPGPARYLRGA